VRDAPSVVPPGSRVLSAEERGELLDEMEEIVERSHLFKSLDDVGRARLLTSGVVSRWAEGDVIILQGAEGETMYLVLSGQVRVTTEAANGEVLLADLGRDACFGEVSVLTGKKRTATVVALSEVDCVGFEKHRIERLLADYPKVREILQTVIEGRARDTVEKILKS
jgi:CRP-like cAMP-binding protein